MDKKKRVSYSSIEGVVECPSRGNTRKLLYLGYEYLLRKKNVFSKRENCNFNVYYCVYNRKKGYVKCTMSIRETNQNGIISYYISSGSHNHNSVNNDVMPPPPMPGPIHVPMLEDFPVNNNNNLIHVPGPTPNISRVEPYEVFEQNPVARIIISSFDSRYYRFQDIINIQLQLRDSVGNQNIPRILNTNVNNMTNDIEIFFLVQVSPNRQRMVTGMIDVTVGFFFQDNRSFQVIGRNAFVFSFQNNNNNNNNNNNPSTRGLKPKKRKLEDLGPNGVGDDTQIFAIYPLQGSIRGGQFVEIFFSVSERYYMDRLLFNQNSIRSCTFGGVNARFQNNVFLVEHNEMKLQFIRDVDKSLYDACSAARFVLPVLTPPGPRLGEVDVELVVMNHVIRKERGYTYVDDEREHRRKNKGVFGNFSKSVSDDDSNIFGFSSSSSLFDGGEGSGGMFDDDDPFDFQRSDLIEDDVDMFMSNALFYCVAQGRLDLVMYLVEEKKFDLQTTDILGYSLRDVAQYFEREEIDEYLVKQMKDNHMKALSGGGGGGGAQPTAALPKPPSIGSNEEEEEEIVEDISNNNSEEELKIEEVKEKEKSNVEDTIKKKKKKEEEIKKKKEEEVDPKQQLIIQKESVRRTRIMTFVMMTVCFCGCLLCWPVLVCCSPLIMFLGVLFSWRYLLYCRERNRELAEKIRAFEDV